MQIVDLDEFLNYYGKLRERTKRVVAAIPAESIEWSPASGQFTRSVKPWTLGDIVRHLAAIERHMYAETIQGRPHRYAGCGRELADGYADVTAFMDRLHAESMGIFGSLTREQLDGKCATPAGTPITVWKWLRAMCEHEIHHRGQIYTCLGLLGVETPPLYGLTSEELVRSKS